MRRIALLIVIAVPAFGLAQNPSDNPQPVPARQASPMALTVAHFPSRIAATILAFGTA